MTTIEAIQMNIHNLKVELNKARKVICNDEMDKMFKQSSIDAIIDELKDLKFSLSRAVKQS